MLDGKQSEGREVRHVGKVRGSSFRGFALEISMVGRLEIMSHLVRRECSNANVAGEHGGRRQDASSGLSHL